MECISSFVTGAALGVALADAGGVVEMKGFIMFACAVVVVCAVAVRFVATHRAKCIKYAERDEFLYMMLVGGVRVPVYDKPCLVYKSEVQK